MLDVILQIFSVIGIVFLILLGIILFLLLLVLFFPITYKFYGSKEESIVVRLKVKWLFGLCRIFYNYPEDSTLYVKVLWHTFFQKKIPSDEAEKSQENPEASQNTESPVEQNSSTEQQDVIQNNEVFAPKEPSPDNKDVIQPRQEAIADGEKLHSTEETVESENKILKKIEKIKYTILKFYDKIKEVWNNITYYGELLKEDNTKALFRHVVERIGKILKSIRPRHRKADIVFGTGSPDTTGYAYGVYGMFSSILGPEFLVEPDFEQAILKGELQFSGHVTVWILLINGLKLFFDPKLHLFIKKVKAGMPKKEK